ncbi:MAG: efflux RND transporter periplasmic adaptor subunit [Planctomycetota bacterium]|jgi:RND family efflux transporter MFP subunit|nr:efflux RND transporter periplasmic adaptor subunit [Planctomycetota bacterium]
MRLLPLAAAAAVLFTAAGCGEAPEATVPEAPRAIKIATATTGSDRANIFTGTIEPFQDVEAAFEVSGRIIESAVDEGQDVKKGDILARLDDRDFVSAKDAAAANYERAKADKERADLLIKDDAIARADYDRFTNSFTVSKSDMEKATKALEDTVLRAPFDGRVARKVVTDLRTIQATEPIFRIHDISRLKVEVSLPESMVVLATDMSLERLRKEVKATARVTAFMQRAMDARLHEVSAMADPKTRTFLATMVIEPPQDLNVLPGMTAVIEARRLYIKSLRIPAMSLRGGETGETFVWVIDDALSVHKRTVKAGEAQGDQVVILDGLEDGEEVAASGFIELTEGMSVRRFTMPGDSKAPPAEETKAAAPGDS